MNSIWFDSMSLNYKLSEVDRHYDIIIIGAGIAGLSCAYWLRESKKKVLVIDQGVLGDGASGRNAGFLTGGSIGYFNYLRKTFGDKIALEKWSFTTNNVSLIQSELNLDDCNFINRGTISLYPQHENIDELLNCVELLNSHGFSVEQNNKYFDMQGINIKSDGMFDPFKVLKHLYSKLELSTDFVFKNKVSAITENSVIVGERTLSANKIILTTNYGIIDFLPDQGIEAKRSQIAYYQCDNSKISDLNFFIPKKRIYFRKYKQGIIIGGLRTLDEEAENTDLIAINEKIQKALGEQCVELFGESKLIHAWAGIMGFTADEQPLLGVKDNIYYLGGFSGHGNGYAFSMARDLVELI